MIMVRYKGNSQKDEAKGLVVGKNYEVNYTEDDGCQKNYSLKGIRGLFDVNLFEIVYQTDYSKLVNQKQNDDEFVASIS